jgi:hypothetical protein
VILGVFSICCAPALGGFGIAAFFFDILPALAAVALGYKHLQRVNKGQATNKNLAIIGIILGVVALVSSICLGANVAGTGHNYHNNVNY